jgi:hypothetical protein
MEMRPYVMFLERCLNYQCKFILVLQQWRWYAIYLFRLLIQL